MKAFCAFVLGVSLTQATHTIANLELSHLLSLQELQLLDFQIASQKNRVGSCSNVSMGLSTLDANKRALVIKGRYWTGDLFAKGQVLRDDANDSRYLVAARQSGHTLWLYRVSAKAFPPDAVDYLFTHTRFTGYSTTTMGIWST